MSLEDTTVALRIGIKNIYGEINYHLILLILEQTIYEHDQYDHHDGGGQADVGEKDLEVNEVFPPWL